MLILLNKAISVACFAMRCWQFFLLPHFSQSIDADMNVSAAHSLKLQREFVWDLLWGGNPCCILGGESSVSALLLSLPMSPRSAAAEGHLTACVGGRCPCGDIQPSSRITSSCCSGCSGHCWHPSLQDPPAAPVASLLSSHVPVGAANSIFNEGFGINAPNLGPSLQSPGFLIMYHHFMVL